MINAVIGLLEAVLLLYIYQILCNNRRFMSQNKLKTLLFCGLYTSVGVWSRLYIPMAYHALLFFIFMILILSYIANITIFTAMVICSINMIIVFVCEFSTLVGGSTFFHLSFPEISANNLSLMLFGIVSKALELLIMILLYKFNVSLTKYNLFKKEGSLYSFFILQLCIFTIFIFSLSNKDIQINNIELYNIFIFIIFFIFFIIGFIELKEREKILKINEKYRIQQKQIQNMEDIITIIREEKHDFANHINVIQALCQLNKANTVERINNYVQKISSTLHSSFRYLDTGNDYIDGLLSIKNNLAVKNNINFICEITEPFNMINISDDSLISIISNLVDNAFEALTDIKEEKTISITTYSENKKFCIEVANNGEVIPHDRLQRIFDRGFSTKTKQRNDCGYGLYITKQLVEKNNGAIIVESSSEKTSFFIKFNMGQ